MSVCYIVPLKGRRKYQRFSKPSIPINLIDLENKGIDVKTWNGESWVKYGYDHINGLS